MKSKFISNPSLIFLKDSLIFACYNTAINKREDKTMTEYEKVEKLCEKCNISYEEARTALEASDWDLLDAIVRLEREGKVSGGAASHSTKVDPEPAAEEEHRSRFAERASTLWDHIRRMIQIGNENSLVIHYKEKQIVSLPITALVILLLCTNIWMLIAMAAGMFFGLRYSIKGEQLGKPQVNDVMDKAANAAENVRETVEDSLRKGN